MEPGAPLIHPDLASYDKDENIVANGNTMAYHTIVKGDADAAMADRRRRRQGPLCLRRVAGRPDRAARRRRAVAGRQGHRLVLDAGALRGARRRGPDAADPRGRRPHRRAAPRRGLRRQVRSALRGPGRGARSCRASDRSSSCSPARRSSARSRSAARASSMEFETGATRDGQIVARKARLVLDKGAYCGEGGFLGQMAAMHACGPYDHRRHPRRGLPELHQQPAVRIGPRPDRAAGLLGPRAAHGRGRPRDRHGSRRAPPPHAHRGGRGGADPPGLREGRACATRSRPPSR